jgi:tetratricopeptide (TPR) repeat protein
MEDDMIDPKLQAEAYFNIFETALELQDWSMALEALRQAAALDGERFSPVPADQYEVKQVLGATPSEVNLLCRHLISNSHLVIKALRTAGEPVAAFAVAGHEEAEDVFEPGERQVVTEQYDEDERAWDEEPEESAENDVTEAAHEGDDLDDSQEEQEHDPELAAFYCDRGRDHRNAGDFDQALADFTEAIRLDPESADARNNRGNIYLALHRHDEAIDDYTEALRLDPELTVAYVNRGLVYALQRNCPEAIADANEAIHLDPELPGGYFLRGMANVRQGEHHDAIADFTEALRLNPQEAVTYNHRGLAYSRLGDCDRAIDDYNQALRLAPDLAPAHFNRASAHQAKGDSIRAIADFSTVIQLEPHSPLAYYNRGLAYIAQQQYDPAIADFNEAYRLDPDNALALFKRDEALRAKNEATKQTSPGRRTEAPKTPQPAADKQKSLVCPACGKKIKPAAEGRPQTTHCPRCKSNLAGPKAKKKSAAAVVQLLKKTSVKPGILRRHWISIGVATIVLLVAGMGIWLILPSPPPALTAYDLWWEIGHKSPAAVHKYDGKLLQIRGVVEEVSPGDAPRIVFREPFPAPPPVECYLDPKGPPGDIRTNQWVTVIGKCKCDAGPTQPIQLFRCRVLGAP